MSLKLLFAVVLSVQILAFSWADDRPNILWLTSEDNGPQLGCYGDDFATTPSLDSLAKNGVVYLNVWSNAPVCAPARTALITGMYPNSLGAEHMRSLVQMPRGTEMFPQLLRRAGYYCTNNRKEDYNIIEPGKVWDESSNKAHWRKRNDRQPFFSVFNFTTTHESQIRKRPHKLIHDPNFVKLPSFHPDTPEVREDWAQYYDKITEMDAQAGEKLRQLEADGLSEDTIVFYFGDHGAGLPRFKRYAGNSGLSVPLIVYIPEKFRSLQSSDFVPGTSSDRLVSFVDFGPTVLSLAGIEPPDYMHGKAFLGEYEAEPREMMFGFRGRMDERIDLVRVARDKRYVYVRNFYPELIYGQHVEYQFQTPTTRIWFDLNAKGEGGDERFWDIKNTEELYDLQSDPDEMDNIASFHISLDVMKRFRNETRSWCEEIEDLGFIPEPELQSIAGKDSPSDVFRSMNTRVIKQTIDAAYKSSDRRNREWNQFETMMNSNEASVRFWGLQGVDVHGYGAFLHLEEQFPKLCEDESPTVRVLANYLCVKHGHDSKASRSRLLELCDLQIHSEYTVVQALNAVDYLDDRMKSELEMIKALPTKSEKPANKRVGGYAERLIKKILSDLE